MSNLIAQNEHQELKSKVVMIETMFLDTILEVMANSPNDLMKTERIIDLYHKWRQSIAAGNQ